MPTAHLICGFIGSGKTTFARKLEKETGSVRFTHDEWMVRIYGSNPPVDKFQEYYDLVTKLIWEQAFETLSQGQDIILDFGFWKRKVRDQARQNLSAYDLKFYAVVCDEKTAWMRVSQRNENLDGQYLLVEHSTFNLLKAEVEPFGPDEDFIIVSSEDNY